MEDGSSISHSVFLDELNTTSLDYRWSSKCTLLGDPLVGKTELLVFQGKLAWIAAQKRKKQKFSEKDKVMKKEETKEDSRKKKNGIMCETTITEKFPFLEAAVPPHPSLAFYSTPHVLQCLQVIESDISYTLPFFSPSSFVKSKSPRRSSRSSSAPFSLSIASFCPTSSNSSCCCSHTRSDALWSNRERSGKFSFAVSHNFAASEEEKCQKEDENSKERPHKLGFDADNDVDSVHDLTSFGFSKDLRRNKAEEGRTKQAISCISQNSREGTFFGSRPSSCVAHSVELEVGIQNEYKEDKEEDENRFAVVNNDSDDVSAVFGGKEESFMTDGTPHASPSHVSNVYAIANERIWKNRANILSSFFSHFSAFFTSHSNEKIVKATITTVKQYTSLSKREKKEEEKALLSLLPPSHSHIRCGRKQSLSSSHFLDRHVTGQSPSDNNIVVKICIWDFPSVHFSHPLSNFSHSSSFEGLSSINTKASTLFEPSSSLIASLATSSIILLICSADDRQSYVNIGRWIHLARSFTSPSTVIALVLNKIDLLRDSFHPFTIERTPSKDLSEKPVSESCDVPLPPSDARYDPFEVKMMKKAKNMVSVEEASAFSHQHNLLFFPCSAKTGEGIEFLFNELAKTVVRRILLKEMSIDDELKPECPFSQLYCSGVEMHPLEKAKRREVEEEESNEAGWFCCC